MFLKISDKSGERVCVHTFDLFVCVHACFGVIVCAVYLWECLLKLSVPWQASG